ncbi:hypothetical protein SAMN05216219_0442 [Mycetocola miduiensis]|uniref:Uncharacterized protein n=1 Tax=Mycetocola miduiensis TaxID=995034 RepID=A0A1I4YQT5_9MICO|nr:hypothetical protein SAMN05216219_0442 [Mycetocola miduiensis]
MLGANGILMDAFYTDVRSDLAAWRESRGLPADPMAAYAASGCQRRIAEERVGGQQAGWGARRLERGEALARVFQPYAGEKSPAQGRNTRAMPQ